MLCLLCSNNRTEICSPLSIGVEAYPHCRSTTPAQKRVLSYGARYSSLRSEFYGSIFALYRDYRTIKWILLFADTSRQLGRWRFQLAKDDNAVLYRPGTTYKIADEMSGLGGGEKKQDVIEDGVPCIATNGSLSKDAAQPEHHEAVIVFLDSIEAENRTEQAASSTVLSIDSKTVTLDPLTQEECF